MHMWLLSAGDTCPDPGIFVRGGRGSRSTDKKALTTFFLFSPQLILQKSNGQFHRNLSFYKVPEGVQLFPGGSNCLFPIETHITCDFPGRGGGPAPLSPLWICTWDRDIHKLFSTIESIYCTG